MSDDLTGEQFEQMWQGKPVVPPNLAPLAAIVESMTMIESLITPGPTGPNYLSLDEVARRYGYKLDELTAELADEDDDDHE